MFVYVILKTDISRIAPCFGLCSIRSDYFVYPHLGHTPFSFSAIPHKGQRSIFFWGSYSSVAPFTPLVNVSFAMFSLSLREKENKRGKHTICFSKRQHERTFAFILCKQRFPLRAPRHPRLSNNILF